MIVVGISPGVRTLVYCVLLFPGQSPPDIVDIDLMKGGRVKQDADKVAVARGTKPHELVLDVVLERALDRVGAQDPPAIVAVGPSASTKEPGDHDLVVREILKNLVLTMQGHGHRIVHREFRTEAALRRALGTDVRKVVNRTFASATTTMRGRGYLNALAAALAAEWTERPKLPQGGARSPQRFT